ncbi:MAG TPA: hypothetical protein VEI48_10430 [Candidatus Sulfotelmatobacter sp.]|nr:hypothetical protein [Candidatus Sulfotelmatobacter sp.]
MAAEPPAGAEGPARLALLIGLVLAAQDNTNRPLGVVILLALAVLLGVSTQWRIGPLVIVALAVAGLAMRLDLLHAGTSDVLTVTRSAIQTVLAGGNPYGIGYATSSPPGAPFPYGPLALAWYVPFQDDPRVVETAVSCLILVVLAVRGRPLGLAVYALALPLLLTASDGSNDNSGGLLLLAALVVLPRNPLGGGALLAVAAAFKPYAAAWLIPLLVWAPVPGLVGFVVVSLVAWAPVYLVWGVPAFLDSLGRSQAIHGGPYYSLGAWLSGVVGGVSEVWLDRVRYVLGAATAVATVPFIRSGRGVVVAGLLIYLVTLYTGFWSTFAYLASIAPIVCWNLDEWVGLDAGRVPWPGDPVGRLMAWADARWPVLAG